MRSKRLAASSAREPGGLSSALSSLEPGTPGASEGSRQDPCWLLHLPSELLAVVLSGLQAQELAALCCACSSLRAASSVSWGRLAPVDRLARRGAGA